MLRVSKLNDAGSTTFRWDHVLQLTQSPQVALKALLMLS